MTEPPARADSDNRDCAGPEQLQRLVGEQEKLTGRLPVLVTVPRAAAGGPAQPEAEPRSAGPAAALWIDSDTFKFLILSVAASDVS